MKINLQRAKAQFQKYQTLYANPAPGGGMHPVCAAVCSLLLEWQEARGVKGDLLEIGVWFGNGAVQLHLGVEADFRPARKAHPALLVDNLDGLEAACRAAGFAPQGDAELPGYARFYVADPFGNRLEFLQPHASTRR